jgi:diguanylate cyclase
MRGRDEDAPGSRRSMSVSLSWMVPSTLGLVAHRWSQERPLLLALAFALTAVVALLVNRRRTAAALQRIAESHEYDALHDALTGLPNRVMFRDRVEQALARARRDGESVGVLVMDLDGFKEINDTLGHHHGDRLLQDMSTRVLRALREVDTVARLGGDEFAVLLPSVGHLSVAATVAGKIRHAVKRPLELDDFRLTVDVSIGIAIFPDHASSHAELMEHADVAMYGAKKSKTGVEIYTADIDRYSPRKLALVHQLRQAIDREELLFHYQPKVSIASGRVVGAEALVRWRHPGRGLLWPNDFLAAAESTTYVEYLMAYTLRTAVRQCSIWRKGSFDIPTAVNLSSRNLADRRLPEKIAAELALWSVPPERLHLEVEASAIAAGSIRSIEALTHLRDLGVGIVLDHFGTATSSLSGLQQVPADAVKIDKSLVRTLRFDTTDRIIVRSVIDMAHSLGMSTTGEGVEDKETLDALAALGCETAQGFWCARPTPPDLLPWLVGLVEAGERREPSL